MSQSIISEWADVQKTQERIDANPELAKLAHEFCKRFGLKVGNAAGLYILNVFTSAGLNAGSLRVSEVRNRESKTVPLYIFRSPCVDKMKGSAHSNRDERDSTKITGLLKSIEKNNEVPTDEKLYKQYRGGIAYAFGQLDRINAERTAAIDYDLAISVFKNVLGNRPSSPHEMQQLEVVMIEHDRIIKATQLSNSLFSRYSKGCTLIGWDDVTHSLLMGKAQLPTMQKTRVTESDIVISDVRRYNRVEDTPHAGLAVMLKEYFKTTNVKDDDNPFGFRRHDAFHEAVDVSCGYAGTNIAWMIVPDEAPTV
jgi:hypothetical protein